MAQSSRGHEVLEPLLRPVEVARALSISTRTVARLVATGELQGVRVGGQIRVRRRALEHYLEMDASGSEH